MVGNGKAVVPNVAKFYCPVNSQYISDIYYLHLSLLTRCKAVLQRSDVVVKISLFATNIYYCNLYLHNVQKIKIN